MKEEIFKTEIQNKEIEIKISNLAEQANGSVFVRCGDTVVMITAIMGQQDKVGIDYFPLEVIYEEKYYAAGKIYGSRFIRRESRPTEIAILSGRMIDRALRPIFDNRLRREIQIIVTVLSIDQDNDPDVLGLIGASAALLISDIPFSEPVGAVRIAKKDGTLLVNPTFQERGESALNAVFAGAHNRINMMEITAKEVPEEDLMAAFTQARTEIQKLTKWQKEIASKIGKQKAQVKITEPTEELTRTVKEFCKDKLEETVFVKERTNHHWPLAELKNSLVEHLKNKGASEEDIRLSSSLFEDELNTLIHTKVIKEDERPDGRRLDQLRLLEMHAGFLPRTHGSGLFIRGLTKALSVTTLASPGEELLIQGIEFAGTKRFLHHYNFPAYSTGEVGFYRGPGRREIGHGALVERALEPVIPSVEKFPYTIRVVSEILSSNGSTSMAAVCAASLSLMDAGVPILRPVAGISIGLISSNDDVFKMLVDIQGPEDHHGDMDFKIAGTEKGVTAIQMDVKIQGITPEIFKAALEAGKNARLIILKGMKEILVAPRSSLSPYAPKIISLQINPEKIGMVIGPGGRMINEIIQKTGVKIDIEENGMVFITSDDENAAAAAAEWVSNIVREFKVGEVLKAKVVRIVDFGAFVELLPGQDALLHISEISPSRIASVKDILKIGDIIDVRIKNIDDSGKISVSLKGVKNSH